MKKNKIITILLTIIVFALPLVRCPRSINGIALNDYTFVPKAIVFLVCGIALLVLLILKIKEKDFKFDTNDKLIFAYWVISSLSTMVSYDTKKSILGWGNRYTGYLSSTGLILIYFSAKYYFQYFKSFFKWLFLIAAGICIYSFMQYFDFMPLHKLLNIGYIKNFAAGTLGNTNFFGSFVSLFIPAAMLMYIFTKEKKYLLYTSIYFGAMICSNARSSWFAFAVYSILILIYIIINKENRKQYLKQFGLTALCCLIVFMILLTQNQALKLKISSIFNDFASIKSSSSETNSNTETTNQNTSVLTTTTDNSKNLANTNQYYDPLGVNITLGSGRVYIWAMALISIQYHPILGAGPACSYYSYVENCPVAVKYFSHVLKGIPADVHNEFLDVAASVGLPAFFIYMLFMITIVCNAYTAGIKQKDKLSFIIATCILSYMLQAFFNISVIAVAPLFWMLLGLSENKDALDKIKKNYNLY